jgi:hypothetical protein
VTDLNSHWQVAVASNVVFQRKTVRGWSVGEGIPTAEKPLVPTMSSCLLIGSTRAPINPADTNDG